ncbi:K(+)/H(+) antiporter [Scheffersomyces amazonensis]|uniref:K(+)/H(+) antiporter n=1 Tax=Scheffersomyces amazonensis TaxID=1078765 RepID=UPI00315CEC36
MAVATSSVGGVVAGSNPLVYSAGAPYTIFLFQVIFVILLCHIVHVPLKRLQQPRVIAEVITGVLLGPSVMGHIPNFTKNCFPPDSLPGIVLFANIGIILFLFIIGLEVDITFIRKNLKVALTVGLINMAVPFALGCGIAKGIYDTYVEHTDQERPIKFTTYMVFIAVAMCITALPVLARILTELNLIGDRVGTIVLAAGITNDLTGWILLALVVILANASNGVNAVYILLLTLAWFLLLCYPIRLTLKFILRKFTNDLSTGEPSQFSMMLILVLVFISAFYTDVIGVHPIFGAFMAGVIIPRDNGYVIRITEKLEDLVHIVLIPLYFANAGLNVNLGLLNRGIDWAYTIGIILLAMVGKIFGGFVAAKFNKLLWRESLAVGALMSCKGIVEIVVLTTGLNAGIISQKVFSMFIVMALVTTFATTPMTLWIYPISYREKRDRFIKGEINWDGTPVDNKTDQSSLLNDQQANSLSQYTIKGLADYKINQFVLLLKRIDTLSYLMTFTKNFNDSDIKAIHLREFTSRTSHLLEASTGQYDENSEKVINDNEYTNSFSILSIIKAFSEMSGINCSARSILSTFKNHVLTINEQISEKSDFLITSIKLNQLTRESIDYSLYKKLFQECKSHFGLLLINDLSVGHVNNNLNYYDDETKASIIDTGDQLTGKFSSLKVINLILRHDNLLSSSDLLSLHLIFKLLSNDSNLSIINVYIQQASGSKSKANQFEQEITNLFKSKKDDIIVNISYIKEIRNIKEDIKRFHGGSSSNELFVISNNGSNSTYNEIAVGSSSTSIVTEAMFDYDVDQLFNLSTAEGFHVLVVQAAIN